MYPFRGGGLLHDLRQGHRWARKDPHALERRHAAAYDSQDLTSAVADTTLVARSCTPSSPLFVAASSGSVHVLTSASRALFARAATPSSPLDKSLSAVAEGVAGV